MSDEARAIATPVDDTINHPSQRSEETKPADWREPLNQEFDHLRKMGINVFLHEGMQRFFEENPDKFVQMAAKRRYSINNTLAEEEKEHLRTLLKAIDKTGTTLLDDGKGTFYLLDHADKEDIEKRKSSQDGFNCRLKFSAKDYTGEELNTIKEKIKYGNIRDQRSFNKWASHRSEEQRGYNSDSIDAKVRGANADNDRLDLQASEGTSLRGLRDSNSSEDFGTGFIRVYNNDGTNGHRYIPISGNNDLPFFMTPRGEVYGFVDKNNDIYLDERKISPEHPIHEYTHIWDRAVAGC